MGIMDIFTKQAADDGTVNNSEVRRIVKAAMEATDSAGEVSRFQETQKVLDFYNGEQKKYLRKNPEEKDHIWTARPKVTTNLTRPIVDRKSGLVYKGRIERAVDARYEDFFKGIWGEESYNLFLQKIDKYSLLTRVCAVRPMREEIPATPGQPTPAARIKLIWYPGDVVTCLRKENSQDIWLLHLAWGKDEYSGKKLYHQIWTDEYFIEIIRGVERATLNPYGFIPFVFIYEEESDFNPHGEQVLGDVINQNAEINSLLTDLAWLIKNQSHSQYVATGVGLNFKITTGPSRVVNLTDKESKLEMLTPQPKVNEMLTMYDALRKALFETSGVPEAAIMPQAGDSGKALIMQIGPLLDYRAEKILRWKIYERKLAEMIGRVAVVERLLPAFDAANMGFFVNFDDKPFPWIETDERDLEQADLRDNIISLVDIMRRRDPDLSEEDAIKRIEANQEINTRYKGTGAVALPEYTL